MKSKNNLLAKSGALFLPTSLQARRSSAPQVPDEVSVQAPSSNGLQHNSNGLQPKKPSWSNTQMFNFLLSAIWTSLEFVFHANVSWIRGRISFLRHKVSTIVMCCVESPIFFTID